jgi:hypothetical protein
MENTIKTFMGTHLTLKQVCDALKERGLDITALEHFNKEDFRHLLDGIKLEDSQVQGVLAPPVEQAAAAAQQLFQKSKDHMAGVYEAARAQFQKSYTSRNKLWVMGLSFLVVLVLNANVIMLYEELSADQVMSQAIAGTADTLILKQPARNKTQDSSGANTTAPGGTGKPAKGIVKSSQDQPVKRAGLEQPPRAATLTPENAAAQPAQQGKANPTNVCGAQDQTDPTRAYENTRDCIREKLKQYPILVRWARAKDSKPNSFSWFGPKLAEDFKGGQGWFETITGLVLMWVLVSLGAPFWNDVLKGMMGVNNALNTNGKKTS